MKDISHYQRDAKGIFIKQFFGRTKECEFCKKTFEPTPKNFKRNRFCSLSCSSKARPSGRLGKKGSLKQREVMKARTGTNHPRWITDRTKALEKHRLRNGEEWRNWRKAVFFRDSYKCQEESCLGSYTILEGHHIVPVRLSDELKFDVKNGITLCRKCHKKTLWKEHLFEDKYKQIVELTLLQRN